MSRQQQGGATSRGPGSRCGLSRTFVTVRPMRLFRHVAQIACMVVVVVTAWGASLAVFAVRCWTVELDLGSLRQPFGVSELSLGHHLSFEEMNLHLIFVPVFAQTLDLLSEEPIFLIGRGLTISAGWWPGLEGVSVPTTRGAGLAGVPKGRGASALLQHL
jgi:hypothetical protein